jgi:hypothetical protein
MIHGLDDGGILKLSADTELIAEQEKEYKKIGGMRLKPGHTLFSVNMQTLEVLPVKIVKQIAVGLDGEPVKIQKTNFDPKLYYVSALNKENAMRHYRKALNQYFLNLKSQQT